MTMGYSPGPAWVDKLPLQSKGGQFAWLVANAGPAGDRWTVQNDGNDSWVWFKVANDASLFKLTFGPTQTSVPAPASPGITTSQP
jgi:hypothetical protein